MSKYEEMIKGFTHLSKAWYGKTILEDADYEDSISFGFYHPDGSTAGEMTVRWVNLSERKVPKLIVYHDAWGALSQFHDLIDLLGSHDSEKPSPEQFCKYLLECGFIDRTELIRR